MTKSTVGYGIYSIRELEDYLKGIQLFCFAADWSGTIDAAVGWLRVGPEPNSEDLVARFFSEMGQMGFRVENHKAPVDRIFFRAPYTEGGQVLIEAKPDTLRTWQQEEFDSLRRIDEGLRKAGWRRGSNMARLADRVFDPLMER